MTDIPKGFKIEKNSRKAIIASTAAIVASGTATLECAVENTPMVVCYKMSTLSWFFIKRLSNIKYSSIVNLIANKEVVPEFLQYKMKPENIKNKLVELLNEKSKLRNQMLDEFANIKEKLGSPGVYIKVASDILKATERKDQSL